MWRLHKEVTASSIIFLGTFLFSTLVRLFKSNLDFSHIPGHPHQYVIKDDWKALFPLFHEYKYQAATHIWAFMQFLQGNNIIHEDIKMKFFLLSLNFKDNWNVKNLYEGFPHKNISSLRQLIDAFGEVWDRDMEEHERKVVINHIW